MPNTLLYVINCVMAIFQLGYMLGASKRRVDRCKKNHVVIGSVYAANIFSIVLLLVSMVTASQASFMIAVSFYSVVLFTYELIDGDEGDTFETPDLLWISVASIVFILIQITLTFNSPI